jgi:hypothetical protein
MTFTTTATTTMDPQIRNQMSLMAWVMAFLCGWALFLSAHACRGSHIVLTGETNSSEPVVTQQ